MSAAGPSGRGASGDAVAEGVDDAEGDDEASGLGVGADDGSPEHAPASSTTPIPAAATRVRVMHHAPR